VEQWIINLTNNYGELAYLAILVWTFLEGETIVLLTAAALSGGIINLNIWIVLLVSFLGSFSGDQLWFAVGRRYGAGLLARWPSLEDKTAGVFRLLDRHNDLFILTFRFIYGLRNISPFAIGMTHVSRKRFLALNALAAATWANAFVWGGYFLGRALEKYLGQASQAALGILVLAMLVGWVAKRSFKSA
jgi:membrane protein DedA with SNARE-associated domain